MVYDICILTRLLAGCVAPAPEVSGEAMDPPATYAI